MAFYGLDFLYDNQFSSNYGLKILTINNNYITDANAGSNVEIFSDSVYRKPTKYHYGVSQSEVLSFELEVMSEKAISAINRSKIEKWLFGRMMPCKLQIVQLDLQTVFFNCYLINPKTIYIGGLCYGFRCSVECDAPWGWQNPKTYTYKDFTEPWKFYNDSDNTDYTYPLVEIKMKNSFIRNGDISIKNLTDNNREMCFVNLRPSEVITIDTNIHSIQSSANRLLSEFFNKIYFRLLSGINMIEIKGEIEYFKMTYCNARKVGG